MSAAAPYALKRVFTDGAHHPFDLVRWERRNAVITGADGRPVFEQTEVEVPVSWSQTATNIAAHKFFRGSPGTPEHETSVRQLIGRVVDTLTGWSADDGYLPDEASRRIFSEELAHLLVHQMAAFNSPVWFNVGVEAEPQCSACFINSVEDSLASILELAKTEGMLFKYGSGTGSNLSSLRSSREQLAGGGQPSGPVSFMRGFDAFAGVIKSGGKTRRAAKMVILDVVHPDIREFITCKVEEERKARALMEAGYDPGFDAPGGAYDSVQYQNANHSVRLSDAFMDAATSDGWWETRAVTTGEVVDRVKACDLLRQIAEAAWSCGDPGVQYDDTINRWNTCSGSGRINASNPCSEFMFLDDTACNLASLNLLAFLGADGELAVDELVHAVNLLILAQEIIVGAARYPTDRIAANSREFRPLGLGYANLGALLMACGLPYDSDRGRATAAAITALLTGAAYRQSARVAETMGSFPAYPVNRESILRALSAHRDHALELPRHDAPAAVTAAAADAWEETLSLVTRHGLRNAQVSCIAPTGTIALLMDCDTTGIEPDLALVKDKRLVGGGMMRLVNTTVERALVTLGYDDQTRQDILAFVETEATVEGAPGLAREHLAVFDCAFPVTAGGRHIAASGHMKMIGAVQPFLSGAVSKTVNVPSTTSSAEIEQLITDGWRLGLKALAIYRDGCKGSQPLTVAGAALEPTERTLEPVRRRLPDERTAVTHKFTVGNQKGYITVGLYEDGAPGELFITMAKEGSTLSGVMDAFATAISMTLQFGVPLESLVRKFTHLAFEPSGWTANPQIPRAASIIDYIFRWLAAKFLPVETQAELGVLPPSDPGATQIPLPLPGSSPSEPQGDARACPSCGMLMQRSGTCHRCLTCGHTDGCSG
jgi:ribonucleoside-diphosphate reductase alpha chain